MTAVEFSGLADPYRRELTAYCYRMLGSIHDAEDQVQETFLRAWRFYPDFDGRASLRTWLYRIATNVCLRALERRARRPLPSGLGGPTDDWTGALTPAPDVAWLQPFPDRLLADDPASVVAGRAGIRLALVAALQYLPPRQRAVLILRDVLSWRAAEVAELLDTSTAAVNSSLQRARAQLDHVAPREDQLAEPTDPEVRALLERYATAFAEADVTALIAVLTEDAVAEMPPNRAWFSGRRAIAAFLAAQVLDRPGRIRMVPVGANGQPGFATYLDGAPFTIHVLSVRTGGIAHVVSFQDPGLFPLFFVESSVDAATG